MPTIVMDRVDLVTLSCLQIKTKISYILNWFKNYVTFMLFAITGHAVFMFHRLFCVNIKKKKENTHITILT